jgi:hypothetical protein
MIEVSLIGFGIASVLVLWVRRTVHQLRMEVKRLPNVVTTPSKYGFDHLKGQSIYRFLQPEKIDPARRFLLVMTPNCPTCYEKMEEARDTLSESERNRVLCLLIDDEKRTKRFLNQFEGVYSFQLIREELLDEMKILIVPCYFEIDDEGIIREASEDIAKLVGRLKGGENDVEQNRESVRREHGSHL